MTFTIREMQPEDYDQKGYVHWKSWQETYAGLIEGSILARQSLEQCQNIAQRYPQNTLIAEWNGRIVGFSCYEQSEADAGELWALYLLKEAQGRGFGRRLLDAALSQMAGASTIALWVLKGNDQAMGFYTHYGFRLTGVEKNASVGTELRMAYYR